MKRVTIINGGTQGVGEAVARRLATQPDQALVLAGRSADLGEALATELSDGGTPSIFVQADMADDAAPQAVVAAADERFGTVHGLVNVAAATSRANLFTDTPDHFDHMMQVNAKAPYFLCQHAARVMVRDGVKGSIVNIGSTAGHGGHTKLTAYAMSKAALQVMTKNVAFGLMRHGIRVNQVNPGWMDTDSEHRTQVTYDGAPENWLEIAEAQRPFGRLVKPWEVANMVVYLLGDEAGLVTGNGIDIDQGVLGAGDVLIPSEADTVWP